jgi:hypothetical protein
MEGKAARKFAAFAVSGAVTPRLFHLMGTSILHL